VLLVERMDQKKTHKQAFVSERKTCSIVNGRVGINSPSMKKAKSKRHEIDFWSPRRAQRNAK
jgi:hypothetical protein